MTNDYRKGWEYRHATDRNFRSRHHHAREIRDARKRLIEENPRARCQSRARSKHAGPLELHHVKGDLTGRSGYRVFCRKHNRAAADQRPGRMTKPHGRTRTVIF